MRKSFFVLAAALFAAPSALAQPLTTAFTYQGELKQSGTAATGTFDLQFKLYDAVSVGSQIGTTLCADNVTIANGKFTTLLDFGNAFSGQKRFIEVSVRADATSSTPCSTLTGYTTLIPRQELTAAPNAAFALTAAVAATATSATTATTATNASQLNSQPASFYLNPSNFTGGTLPSGLLGGTYTGFLQFTNPMNSFTGIGSGLTALNASNLSTGTLLDARLSANIPRLNVSNTFSGATNSFSGILHSTTTGYRFPDNSVQITAALDPGNLGFTSGYPVGSTFTVTINGTAFPTARMIGFWRINRPTSGTRQWSTPPTLRRPRTSDTTWFDWVQNGTTLSALRLTVTFPDGAVDYDIPAGRVSAYRLLTGDDGLPFEEITYICGNTSLPTNFSTLHGSSTGVNEPTVAPRLGESTGTPSSTYRSVWGTVRSDVIRIVGNPVFTVPIDPPSGNQTGQIGSAIVTLRTNALADDLNLDGGSQTRPFHLVLHPSAGADIVLTNLVNGLLTAFTVRLADDGLPVEEYEVTFPFQPPP